MTLFPVEIFVLLLLVHRFDLIVAVSFYLRAKVPILFSQDERLAGGYENVPTVDIHTNQIGWEQHWLEILRRYVKPLNGKVFEGYFSEVRLLVFKKMKYFMIF